MEEISVHSGDNKERWITSYLRARRANTDLSKPPDTERVKKKILFEAAGCSSNTSESCYASVSLAEIERKVRRCVFNVVAGGRRVIKSKRQNLIIPV